jgi:hypothetical protein
LGGVSIGQVATDLGLLEAILHQKLQKFMVKTGVSEAANIDKIRFALKHLDSTAQLDVRSLKDSILLKSVDEIVTFVGLLNLALQRLNALVCHFSFF